MTLEINDKVLDPRDNYQGREPKTNTYFQPTSTRILLRCSHTLSKIELLAFAGYVKREEDLLIREYITNPIVAGYGDSTSRVEVGDKVVLGDNYSVLLVNITKDDKFYKNIVNKMDKELKDKRKASKIISVHSTVPDNKTDNGESTFDVNIYFLVDEYLIVGRRIETPNA